jgi:hypothetical protein
MARIVGPGLLGCDNFDICGQTVPQFDDDATTVAHARARGWHVFSGPTMSDYWVEVILCESCVGSPRARLPRAPKVLDGQGELF